MRSETLTIGGGSFHYLDSGPPDAPILLLLHGFPEYSGAWADLAPHLDGYRLIAPDQRGYGRSWAPSGIGYYKASELVGDMVQLISHLGGAPVVAVGHDWGAAVAYALTIVRPDLVERLIVMNGVHPVCFQRELARGGRQSAASQYITWLRRDGSEDALAKDDFAHLLNLFSNTMDMSWLSGDRLAAYKQEWARPGRLQAMVNWYRATPLAVANAGQPLTGLPYMHPANYRVPVPHLLIWGENDTALLPETYAELGDFCDDLTVQTLPGTDHWLHHQDPAGVAAHIKAWLARPAT